MTRPTTPAKIRNTLLREYNHRCAICGSDRPQIHHVDEDPSNNDLQNLLPLCPNCHLRDQHDPTHRIDAAKLKFFRRHRDPGILKPQFHPIFCRLRFLDEIDLDDFDPEKFEEQVYELAHLLSMFEIGAFYAERVRAILGQVRRYNQNLDKVSDEEWRRRYYHLAVQEREKVKALTVEMLRYQPWANDA